MQKILQYLMDLKAEDFPKDAHEMSKIAIPYVEVDLDDTWEKILGALLSGVFVLLLDGYEKAVLIMPERIPPEGWRSRTRTRYSGDPRTASWRQWYSIQH